MDNDGLPPSLIQATADRLETDKYAVDPDHAFRFSLSRPTHHDHFGPPTIVLSDTINTSCDESTPSSFTRFKLAINETITYCWVRASLAIQFAYAECYILTHYFRIRREYLKYRMQFLSGIIGNNKYESFLEQRKLTTRKRVERFNKAVFKRPMGLG